VKEATGEMNMTVVTIIAIGAIIAFFWLMWPSIQTTINNEWGTVSGDKQTCTEDANGTITCQ